MMWSAQISFYMFLSSEGATRRLVHPATCYRVLNLGRHNGCAVNSLYDRYAVSVALDAPLLQSHKPRKWRQHRTGQGPTIHLTIKSCERPAEINANVSVVSTQAFSITLV